MKLEMASSNIPSDQNVLPLDFPELVKPKRKITSLERPLWTHSKAKLVQNYLRYFVYVTQHGTYIDGFAGPQQQGQEDMWSAKLVIESEPARLRHFYLYDIDEKQIALLKDLERKARRKQPRLDIRVNHGDFNLLVHDLVKLRTIKPKEATFCLLDQRTFECYWSTVETLAKYKSRGHKIELFYFVPVGWMGRAMAALSDPQSKLEPWWGRDDWDVLFNKKSFDIAKLFCARFEELQYEYVVPWAIYDREHGGGIKYYMIHATDHPIAPILMRRAYVNSVRSLKKHFDQEIDFN